MSLKYEALDERRTVRKKVIPKIRESSMVLLDQEWVLGWDAAMKEKKRISNKEVDNLLKGQNRTRTPH